MRGIPLQQFELEHVPCDLCGCLKYRVRYRKPDSWLRASMYQFPVVECTDCGLVFVNPRPTRDSMRSFYPADYHADRNTDACLQRYERQMRFLSVKNHARWLDVGCARGDFLSFVLGKCPTLECVGVDAYSAGVDNDAIEFYHCLLPDAPLTPQSFDVVTAWAVFEHLHAPTEYFRAVRSALKDDGEFVFLVTNSESLYGSHAYIEDIPRHTYHFSERTLRRYADKCGFTSCAFEYCDDIYDGRGLGTFRFAFKSLAGWNWEKELSRGTSRIESLLGRVGAAIDSKVFQSHWEARMRRSGIIVASFRK